MKKMNQMCLMLLFALFLVVTSENASAQKVNFSGKWKLDKTQGDFGGQSPSAVIQEFTVTDQEKTITIDDAYHSFDKPLPYNGKTIEVIKEYNSKTKSTKQKSITRSDDGKSITIKEKQMNIDRGLPIVGNYIHIWSLSADQNELIAKITFLYDNGKSEKITAVYSRQEN